MNGKTIKKKISKHQTYEGRVLITAEVSTKKIFGGIPVPPKPSKPEGWEDNLYAEGWRRTVQNPDGNWTTEIVTFGSFQHADGNQTPFAEKKTCTHEVEDRLPESLDWVYEELPELLEIWEARVVWGEKFLSGTPTGNPTLDALMRVSEGDKPPHCMIVEDKLILVFFPTYSAKNKREVSARLHKAFRAAKKQGVRLTLRF